MMIPSPHQYSYGTAGLENNSQPLVFTIGSLIRASGFVCFVALRPKSTAMVIAAQSVHLTTLFPGQA